MDKLTNEQDKNKLNDLVATYWREAVNKSIATYWQDKFVEQLQKTNITAPVQTIQPVIQPQTKIDPAKTNFEPIDTTTGQPVTPVIPTEPTINEPVVNEPIKTEQKINEPVKTETTTWTTTWTETPTVDLTKIQTVDDWKKQTGGWMNNLESWVEKAYWTTATQENGKLTAEVNGKKYEWTLDEAWNPNKKEITLSPQQLLQDKIRKIKFNKYSSLPDQQLQTSLANWSLVPWTQSYNDLMLDPNQKARIQKLEKLNLIAWKNPTQEQILDNASNDIANNTNITVWWQEMTLAQAMKDWTINQDEFNQMTNNSQITTKAEEVEDLANDLARQRADYEAIKKATEEEMKGTGASRIAINQLIADRQESLLWPLNLAITDYNNALWTLTELKKSSADLFALNYDSYKTQEQRTYDEQLAQKQLQQKFDYEYWDLNSTDPNVQRVAAERIAQAVQTQYAWLMFRRSVPEMSQDILNELASWKTMWEISTEITNAIQNAPAYENWAIGKWLIAKPETNKFWFTEVWGNLYRTDDKGNIELAVTWPTKYTKLDDWTYQDNNGNIVTKSEIDQQKLLWNKYLSAKRWDYVWIECWQYARSAVWLTWTPWWNSYKARVTAFSDKTPVPWWMVLFKAWVWWYDKTYWHIAVVTWFNPETWRITIKESNLEWDNKVTIRELNANANTISGFYNNTPLTWWGKSEALSDKQFTQSNQVITSFKSDPQVKAFETAYSQWLSLISSLNAKSWPWDVAGIFQFMKTLDPQSVVREAEFEVAANSAWVASKLWNTWDKLSKWKLLTEEQAVAFWNLAKQFIIDKASLYDMKYQDWIRRLQKQWIDTTVFPNSIADEMRKQLTTPKKTPKKQNISSATLKSWNTYNREW